MHSKQGYDGRASKAVMSKNDLKPEMRLNELKGKSDTLVVENHKLPFAVVIRFGEIPRGVKKGLIE